MADERYKDITSQIKRPPSNQSPFHVHKPWVWNFILKSMLRGIKLKYTFLHTSPYQLRRHILECLSDLSVHFEWLIICQGIKPCSLEIKLDLTKASFNGIKFWTICHIENRQNSKVLVDLLHLFRLMDHQLIHVERKGSVVELLVKGLDKRSKSLGIHSFVVDWQLFHPSLARYCRQCRLVTYVEVFLVNLPMNTPIGIVFLRESSLGEANFIEIDDC